MCRKAQNIYLKGFDPPHRPHRYEVREFVSASNEFGDGFRYKNLESGFSIRGYSELLLAPALVRGVRSGALQRLARQLQVKSSMKSKPENTFNPQVYLESAGGSTNSAANKPSSRRLMLLTVSRTSRKRA
jgi:hypothetical protein